MARKFLGIFHLLLLTCVLSNLAAQDVQLKLIDAVSLTPVAGANIFCTDEGGQKSAIRSADNGTAVLTGLQFPMKVAVSMIGYDRDTISLTPANTQWRNYAYYHTILLNPRNSMLKKTVVTGQLVPVLGSNSIYKVNAITESEIAERAAVNLTDVLQLEMNQFVSNDNILGASNNISGIGAQNVKILLNGVPLNGSEAGFIDLNQININNVKRIETVQGPMSVMYGSNALGGVINIITKEAETNTEVGLRTYMDNIFRFNVGADVGIKKNRHNLKASVGRNLFQGWTPYDTLSRWLLWKPKIQHNADLTYRYTLPKGKLSLYTFFLNEEIENKGVPSVTPFKAFAFDEYYVTNRLRNTVDFDYQLSKNEYFKSQSTFSIYDRKKNRYLKDLVSMESQLTNDIQDHDTSVFNQYHFRGAVSSNRIRNADLMLGYEANYETSQSTKVQDGLKNMFELGLFSSMNYSYKKLSIMPSFRFNVHSYFRQNVSYGLHLKYSPSTAEHYRISVAQGYRTPTIKELYLEFIDNNHRILGNENLRQEEGLHAEISGEKKWQLSSNTDFYVEGNAMYNLLKNKIALNTVNITTNELRYFNIDAFENFIAYIKFRLNTKYISTSLGLSRTQILQSTGLPANTFADVLSSLSVSVPKIDTRINLFYRYTANQPIYFVDGSFALSKSLNLANVSVSKNILESKIRLRLGVKNVFNIQNNFLNDGGAGMNTSPHGGENNTTLMLPRSVFLEILYKM